MKKTLLFALLFSTAFAHAQPYVLTSFNNAYQELTNATIYTEDELWDDPDLVLDLPFPFQLGANSYTTIFQLGYGAEVGTLDFVNSQLNLLGYYPDIMAGQNIKGASPSEISWKTDGAVGNRIFKLQFKNVGFFEEIEGFGSADNRANFQFWFYEANSALEFRFGPSNIANPDVVYYGDPGPIIYVLTDTDVNTGISGYGAKLTGAPANPTLTLVQGFIDYDLTPGLTGTPANGQVYRLANTTVSVNDRENSGISLFPTLAEDEIFLRGDLPIGSLYTITTSTGSRVDAGILNDNRIDISALATGMYIINLDGSHAMKFVKR